MMRINFLEVDTVEIHFEVVANNGVTYYYRTFTNTITADYPRAIGASKTAPEYVTIAASVAIRKVYNLLLTAHIMGLNSPDGFTLTKHDILFRPLRFKKYGNIDKVVNAANDALTFAVESKKG